MQAGIEIKITSVFSENEKNKTKNSVNDRIEGGNGSNMAQWKPNR